MVEILALGYTALALVCFAFIGILIVHAYKNACSWCSHPMHSHYQTPYSAHIRECIRCYKCTIEKLPE